MGQIRNPVPDVLTVIGSRSGKSKNDKKKSHNNYNL
jgi:hypothetical protein